MLITQLNKFMNALGHNVLNEDSNSEWICRHLHWSKLC